MTVEVQYDADKGSTHHIDVEKNEEHDMAAAGFGDADAGPPKGFARFLRRNPSMEFMQEVAAECAKDDLDPEEVKRVSLACVACLL